MEQNFQTSFIPKKSIVKERSISAPSVSVITVISLFAFFAVLVGTGALYFYKGVLEKNIVEMKSTLEKTQNRLEPATIAELSTLDNRLIAATKILENHVAVTPIFEALQAITMKTVRFTSFEYTLPADSGALVLVKLGGVAIGYRSVALQADLFAKNENFIDPVFSNLQLDDKGNVVFDLTFSVDSGFINYKKSVLTKSSNN